MPIRIPESVARLARYKPPIGRRDALRLDLNEHPSALSDAVGGDAFTRTAYPEYDALLAALGAYAGQPPERIALTNGAEQAIDLLVRILFAAGDTVVMPSPVFFAWDYALAQTGAQVRHVAYRDAPPRFAFPAEETLAALDNASGLILCHPNNPLGCAIPMDALRRLLDAVQERNIPCIVDEAYVEFCGGSIAGMGASHDTLIVVRTFSKAFGLAGVRLGYVLAAHDVVHALLAVRPPWAVNHFAVRAGLAALAESGRMPAVREHADRIRSTLAAGLRARNFTVYDTDTNFLIVRTKNAAATVARMRTLGVLVNAMHGYPFDHGLLDNTVRVSLPREADVSRVLDAFGSDNSS